MIAPAEYESSGTQRAWYTIPNTAAPSTSASRISCLPSAAAKQPRPTITGHNCRFTLSRCEMAAHTAATIAKLKALVVEALICWASSSEGGLRRQHNGLAGRGATAVWLRSLNYIGFHRVILRQSQPIGPRRSLEIARLHALPELPLVIAGEGRGVLLRLVAED